MEHTLCEFSKYCRFAKKFSSRSFLNDTKKCEFYQHVERNEKFVVKYFWTPTKWSKVRAPEKFVTTVSWTRILHGTYSIFTSPLAYLSVGRFLFMSSNVMTSNNDCYFIPTVGMLGASKIAILIWIAISGVRTEDSASVP